MASSREYLDWIMESFDNTDVTYRPMMGEYLLYYRGKLFGGVYDDRLLVKVTKSAETLLSSAPRAIPYEGAKEMLLVEDIEDRETLGALLDILYRDLPAPKKR